MTDYFVDFAPADAVQFPEGLADGDGLKTTFDDGNSVLWVAEPGQWLVCQGGESWVQDDEPARVTGWEWGARAAGDHEVTLFESEGDARDPGKKWLMGQAHTVYRRPIVVAAEYAQWTGPWMRVEGGAE